MSTKTCPSRWSWSGSTPPDRLAHHPLVQVMLAWNNFPGQVNDPATGLSVGDLQVAPLLADTQTAKMDLVFFLKESLDRGR